MRVVTTCSEPSIRAYGQRWLDSRRNWPEGTEFWWFTEGYTLPHQPDELEAIEVLGLNGGKLIERRDLLDQAEYVQWRTRHAGYIPPDWRFDVIKFSCKVFASTEAFKGYDGVGVWLDADCETFGEIPEGLVEAQVADDYIACYQRTGMYSETGMWIVNCAHPAHAGFMAFMREIYLTDKFRQLHHWHDCFVLDAAIRKFVNDEQITVKNLSGDHANLMHPQARTEFARYIDHMKGGRKARGRSPENKFREVTA